MCQLQLHFQPADHLVTIGERDTIKDIYIRASAVYIYIYGYGGTYTMIVAYVMWMELGHSHFLYIPAIQM